MATNRIETLDPALIRPGIANLMVSVKFYFLHFLVLRFPRKLHKSISCPVRNFCFLFYYLQVVSIARLSFLCLMRKPSAAFSPSTPAEWLLQKMWTSRSMLWRRMICQGLILRYSMKRKKNFNAWNSCVRTADWNGCIWSSQFWLRGLHTLGNLRSYDGNCNENVTLKLNFALS